jgi:hypothetical protein
LKTEEQLEKEDQVNHGLKLEELLRKGTPAALAEANEMMKMMSGYDTSKKPDYKKEVNQEIERIESKVILLNDMLNQKTAQDFKKPDHTIEELYGSTKTAQGRLQKFIEENDDEDRLNGLLELNDLINIVVQKYSDLKNGKQIQKNNFDRPQQNQSVNAEPRGAINLIDFDDFSNNQPTTFASFDPFNGNNSSATKPAAGGLLDEFSSLQFGAAQTQFQLPQQSSATQSHISQVGLQPQLGFTSMNQYPQPSINSMSQPNPFMASQAFQSQNIAQIQTSSVGFPNGTAAAQIQPINFGVQSFQNTPQASIQPFGDLLSLSGPMAKPAAQPVQTSASNDLLGVFGNTNPLQKPVPTGMRPFDAIPSVPKECKAERNYNITCHLAQN